MSSSEKILPVRNIMVTEGEEGEDAVIPTAQIDDDEAIASPATSSHQPSHDEQKKPESNPPMVLEKEDKPKDDKDKEEEAEESDDDSIYSLRGCIKIKRSAVDDDDMSEITIPMEDLWHDTSSGRVSRRSSHASSKASKSTSSKRKLTKQRSRSKIRRDSDSKKSSNSSKKRSNSTGAAATFGRNKSRSGGSPLHSSKISAQSSEDSFPPAEKFTDRNKSRRAGKRRPSLDGFISSLQLQQQQQQQEGDQGDEILLSVSKDTIQRLLEGKHLDQNTIDQFLTSILQAESQRNSVTSATSAASPQENQNRDETSTPRKVTRRKSSMPSLSSPTKTPASAGVALNKKIKSTRKKSKAASVSEEEVPALNTSLRNSASTRLKKFQSEKKVVATTTSTTSSVKKLKKKKGKPIIAVEDKKSKNAGDPDEEENAATASENSSAVSPSKNNTNTTTTTKKNRSWGGVLLAKTGIKNLVKRRHDSTDKKALVAEIEASLRFVGGFTRSLSPNHQLDQNKQEEDVLRSKSHHGPGEETTSGPRRRKKKGTVTKSKKPLKNASMRDHRSLSPKNAFMRKTRSLSPNGPVRTSDPQSPSWDDHDALLEADEVEGGVGEELEKSLEPTSLIASFDCEHDSNRFLKIKTGETSSFASGGATSIGSAGPGVLRKSPRRRAPDRTKSIDSNDPLVNAIAERRMGRRRQRTKSCDGDVPEELNEVNDFNDIDPEGETVADFHVNSQTEDDRKSRRRRPLTRSRSTEGRALCTQLESGVYSTEIHHSTHSKRSNQKGTLDRSKSMTTHLAGPVDPVIDEILARRKRRTTTTKDDKATPMDSSLATGSVDETQIKNSLEVPAKGESTEEKSASTMTPTTVVDEEEIDSKAATTESLLSSSVTPVSPCCLVDNEQADVTGPSSISVK